MLADTHYFRPNGNRAQLLYSSTQSLEQNSEANIRTAARLQISSAHGCSASHMGMQDRQRITCYPFQPRQTDQMRTPSRRGFHLVETGIDNLGNAS